MINMGIDLRCANVAVPKKFLNNAKVSAPSQHVCCKTVAKGVRVHIIKASSFCNPINDLPNGHALERSSSI